MAPKSKNNFSHAVRRKKMPMKACLSDGKTNNMTKQTYKERLIAGLLALGWVKESVGRYTVFTKADSLDKMFVGEKGALRYGRCATKSISIGDPGTARHTMYAKVLEAGTVKEPTLE